MSVPEMTLCHIIDDSTGSILLKKANRGVSKGKWNAVGGKIEPKETPYEGAIREAYEESGLLVEDLFYHGRMLFHLDAADFVVHLFSTHNVTGSLKASDEGNLLWFKLSEIPYDDMWDDDNYWMGLMLRGILFDAEFFYYKGNGAVQKAIIDRKFPKA